MSLTPGSRLGPYEILAAIGAGGMGEVYRARDTKLNRDVALKTLPDAFAAEPDRLARFQREAQVLATLNHPNIAAVYAVEDRAIVMELVEGEDLAQRLAHGPIPYDEALTLARQVVEALAAAHDAGIVHRDLKPANIKVTPDGRVKVLDFGLAKAMGVAGSEDAASTGNALANSPTLTARATQLGMILGTAAYMAPEQARGRPVDRRVDIWAFGCVLFEMLTARRLFMGEDMTETMAAVVKEQPDLTPAPPQVQRLLRRCLEKDPKRRLRDIGDVWDLLDERPTGATAAASQAPSRLPWIVAAAGVLAAVVMAVVLFSGTAATPPPASRFQVSWPGGAASAGGAKFFAISPDGRSIAMVVQGALWVRPIDSVEPARLDRTDGATYPFWSSDSVSIGFFAGGQLKKISRAGGSVQVICDAPDGRGAAWSRNGTVLFSDAFGYEGLKRVPEAGGTPVGVTKVVAAGASDGHRYPQFLPDGEHFIYLHLTGVAAVAGVYAGSLDGSAPVRVLDGQDSAVYAPPQTTGGAGHLLVRRREALMAQAFDAGRREVSGALFPVAEGVGQGENTGLTSATVSNTGLLVYAATSSASAEMVWIDRSGKRLDAVTPVSDIDAFALSRDQRRLVVGVRDDSKGDTDLWTQALPGGSLSKFTFGPSPGWSLPVWSPNGSELAYVTSDLAGLARYEIRRKASNMTGTEETLAQSDTILFLWDWSLDGKFLAYSMGNDLWLLPLDGKRTPTQFTKTPPEEQYAQVSPDGRWMAYASGDRGQMDVYVQPIPATGALWLVSKGGGSMPRWRKDGKELYFRGADGRLMAVAVGAAAAGQSGSFSHGAPQPLFGSIPTIGNIARYTYQPSVDGQRFLIASPVGGASPVTVVLNWQMGVGR